MVGDCFYDNFDKTSRIYGEHIGDIDDYWVIKYNETYYLWRDGILGLLVNVIENDNSVIIEQFVICDAQIKLLCKLLYFFCSRLGKQIIIKDLNFKDDIFKLLWCCEPILNSDNEIIIYGFVECMKKFNHEQFGSLSSLYDIFVKPKEYI
jgi:hypothetical protein